MPTTKKTVKKAVKKAVTSAITTEKAAVKKAVKKVAPQSADAKAVTFEYFSPDSTSVYVAGTFNNWEMAKMKKDKSGTWKYSVELPEGDYQYKYVFEGVSWEVDGNAPSISTEFGLNNIIIVK
jgi:1,4-alpha-glucan branching enzyme